MNLIKHTIDNNPILQRATDGYINATLLCKASGKLLGDYGRLKQTIDFIEELSRSMGIPIDLLVKKTVNGPNLTRGTWVHPQVAINLAQWLSPKFAVAVSKWVFEWMTGGIVKPYQTPYYIRRAILNRHKIPPTHFSMLNQIAIMLLGPLEDKGYVMPDAMMPDISLGRMFCSWLRGKGYDPDSLPTYPHEFNDGRRPTVYAKLYPNELLSDFNIQLRDWIMSGKALTYFRERDLTAIKPLTLVCSEIKLLST